MNTLLTKSTLSAAIALTLVACGGGSSGGVAGIGGSGFVSSGSVTGFGSIFVNGVEFETDTAEFEIEDTSGSQSDLVEGMRVKVSGTINADGITGTATKVEFEDQLEGPISSTITEDADQENKTFTVLGVTVNVNALDTIFAGTGFSYDSIVNGTSDNIQISGFFDEAGELQATAVVRKDTFVAGTTIIEAKGTISGFSANNFTLTVGSTTLTVDASGADLSQVTGGLTDGQFVEVKGTITAVDGTSISATLVKPEDNNPAEGAEVEIEGIITDFDSAANTFKIDGISVNASAATKTPATLVLRDGIKVEVEGPVTDGVILANKLKLRDGNVKIHAIATGVDSVANTLMMNISDNQVKVTIDTSTRLEDKLSAETISQTVAQFEGKFLRVRGIDNGDGITATRIRIDDLDDDVILQGIITDSVIGVSVTVLGVTVEIDGNTDFEDINDNGIGQGVTGHTTFNGQITAGITLVKIKDKYMTDGIADEVELEQP